MDLLLVTLALILGTNHIVCLEVAEQLQGHLVSEEGLNETNEIKPCRLIAAVRTAGKRVNEEGDNER